MNLQQIRILGEALQRDLNLTEVAKALNTSQSGVSKHIMDLEQELGVSIFVRHGKRIVALTEPGKELAPLVERILVDLKNIRSIATHFSRQDVGRLAQALVKHAPERMLWASNWPHPSAREPRPPEDADLLDLLLDCSWNPVAVGCKEFFEAFIVIAIPGILLIRRTLTRTMAPILRSLRRMVPQVARAYWVCCSPLRRSAHTST